MRIVKRIVWVALVAIVVVAASLTGLIAAVTLRALPQTDGTIAIDGLDGRVSVLRDANGIVHIQADTAHDLFLAQGYVHAQERMWQMEVWRHISAGRLSELFGKNTLDQDRFIRTLGWRHAAERDLAALSPTALAVVRAYADGVNAWLDRHRGGLGMPFFVTGFQSGSGGLGGYEPEPWTPLDTIAWQKVQAWQLGGNFETEVFRMLADARLGDPALTDVLFPAYAPDMPVITPTSLIGAGPETVASGGAASALQSSNDAAAPTAAFAADGSAADAWRAVAALGNRVLQTAGLDAADGLAGDHGLGSNGWVVGPAQSGTDGAMLANDPHLGIGMPSVWFINGLHCRSISEACPYDVAGVSFPGVPAVVLGHNARIAWGATNVDPDVQDLFVEEPDPTSDDHYLVAGQPQPFSVRREVIEVAGGEPVTMEVRQTVHGPILNDVDGRLAESPLLALRWAATAEVDGTLEAVLRVNVAGSFAEFREALRSYGAPAQNFTYADVDGHIGYVLPGRIPIRADAADRGARVRSGSDGAHEWIGWIPYDELPWQLDPPSGLIVTANNAAVDGAYPYFVASEWDPGYRAKRIGDLLAAAATEGGGVTLADQREIQADGRILRFDLVRPWLDGATPSTEDGALVAAMIYEWQGGSSIDSLGCSAYLAFEVRLLRGLFDDDLAELAREYVGGGASWQAMIALLSTPDSPWWDDRTTPDITETSKEIIAAALDAAGADLRTTYGDPEGWAWGTVHQASFREQTLGSSGLGPLEWYFNKGPFEAPGAAGAVNNNYYRPSRAYPDPDDPDAAPGGPADVFEVTNLPSYRLRIDMSDLDGARIVQTTGQSGNPFDAHYGDLIDEWLDVDSVAFPFSPAAIEAATVRRLELVP